MACQAFTRLNVSAPTGILAAVRTIGQNIRRAREAAGYTDAARQAAAFARLIKVNPAKLKDWESGRHASVSIKNLMRVAVGAKCSVEFLIDGIDRAYDETITRAGLSYAENKGELVTPSVPVSGVQDELPGPGGPLHVAAEADRDRLSQSEAVDVEMQRLAPRLASNKRTLSLIDRLEQSSADVRTVADALRADLDPAAARAKKPRHPGGRAAAGQAGTRKRRHV